jgi:hypothetical protein
VPQLLVPKRPVPQAFEAEYLEYNRILPLEVTGERLRVADVGLGLTFPPRTGQRRIGGSRSGTPPGGPDDDAPEVHG